MLFVDLWQSPIMGFTHYETCLELNTFEKYSSELKLIYASNWNFIFLEKMEI